MMETARVTCDLCTNAPYWRHMEDDVEGVKLCKNCSYWILTHQLTHFPQVIREKFSYLVLYQVLELEPEDELAQDIAERFKELHDETLGDYEPDED